MKVYKRGNWWWAMFSWRDPVTGARASWRKSLRLDVSMVGKREAERRALQIRRELEAPPQDAPAPATPFSGLALHWFQTSSPGWAGTTRDRYEAAIRLYLVPRFGDQDASTISAVQVLELRAQLVNRGLSPSTVNHAMTVLRGILRHGQRIGRVGGNHAEGIGAVKPTDTTAQVQWWTGEQTRLLLEHAAPQWRTMLLVALRTGLRPGELLALKWAHLDLAGARLYVRQTRKRVDGALVDGPPKSATSLRTVPLSSEVVLALREHRHLASEYVFCSYDQGHGPGSKSPRPPVPVTRFKLECAIKEAAEAAGVPVLTLHGLRHSFASQLVNRGVPLATVASLLGHKSIKSTQIYAHLAPSTLQSAVDLLSIPAPESLPESGAGKGGA